MIRIYLRQIYDYLIFAWVFRTFWPKMGVLWGKIGEGMVRYWPSMNSFFLLGVLTSVPILVKIDQEMWSWECSQTDTLTDASRFYNLSHDICYSYGTDNKKRNRLTEDRARYLVYIQLNLHLQENIQAVNYVETTAEWELNSKNAYQILFWNSVL